MWRKLTEYALQSALALSWQKRRFFLVRTAAALGEIQGHRETAARTGRSRRKLRPDSPHAARLLLAAFAGVAGILAVLLSDQAWTSALGPAAGSAAGVALVLLAKSMIHFSQTGPTFASRDPALLLARLALCAPSAVRVGLRHQPARSGRRPAPLRSSGHGVWSTVSTAGLWIASLAGIGAATVGQFVRKLVLNPGLLVASMHYRKSRLYALWSLLNPTRLVVAQWAVALSAAGVTLTGVVSLVSQRRASEGAALALAAVFYAALIALGAWRPEPAPRHRTRRTDRPNIVMIGSDTLRADRFGAAGYPPPPDARPRSARRARGVSSRIATSPARGPRRA